jgi:integrase
VPRKLKGIRRRRNAWEVNVRVNGHLYTDTFPLTTPVQEMRDWREEQVDKFGGERDAAGGLGEKVKVYLQRVAAMPTIDQRTAHLALWVHELGADRPPLSVKDTEIDIVLQDWLETLAPGTVRKRRTALRSFYSKMYPKKVNPVKGTTNPKEPPSEARDLGYPALERAIAAMPDHRDTKKGLPRRVSKSKIRARCIGYAGIPPGLLQTILSHDLQLTVGTVRIVPRSKGDGIEARTLTLSVEGLAAFKDFHAANCYGYFATESLNRSFKRGCKRAGLDPKRVHLYDARHTFLSQVYRVTRDRSTVERLGLHAKGSVCSARYTKAADEEVDAAAVAAFSAALATQRQLALKSASVAAVKPARPRARRVEFPKRAAGSRRR